MTICYICGKEIKDRNDLSGQTYDPYDGGRWVHVCMSCGKSWLEETEEGETE